MSAQLLVLSDRETDIEFWKKIAVQQGMNFQNSVEKEEITTLLKKDPDSLILWDAECEKLKGLDQLFLQVGAVPNIFVVTESAPKKQPHLFLPPLFSHHLYRRYDSSAEYLCNQLVKQSLVKNATGFEDYFQDEILDRRKVTVTASAQKSAVIDDFRAFMIGHGILTKLADMGGDAIDEFIMNALFDAPFNEDGYYRRKLPRTAQFDLSSKETIEIELVIGKEMLGIRVVDQFGSLKPESAVRCLGKSFDHGYFVSDADPGAGLGLHKLSQSAMSLVFLVKPGISTECIALFGNKRSYRDLKLAFSFFSVQSSKPGAQA